jgi:pimeloyl-ACP methyl ester carboxylesterase
MSSDPSNGGYHQPSSVVIVGHSMGGFVARALFLHPSFRPGTVDTVLTLNTPHTYASPPLTTYHVLTTFMAAYSFMPLLLHRSVADLYHKVNGFWRQQFNMPRASVGAFPTAPSTATRATTYGWVLTLPPAHNIESQAWRT